MECPCAVSTTMTSHSAAKQRQRALQTLGAHIRRRGDAQAPTLVLGGVGKFLRLLDVLDRDQADAAVVLVHHHQLLDAVLVQKPLRLVHRHVLAHGDQVFLGHQFVHALAVVGRETDVAVGEDPDQLARLAAALDHRNAGNVVALHQGERIGERRLGSDRQRIDHHAGFELLHAADLIGLLLRRQIAVDDAHPPCLGHRDRKTGLRDRVHRRRNQRDAELDLARQPRPRIDLARQHGRRGGDQKNVVKRQRFANRQGSALFNRQGVSLRGPTRKGERIRRICACTPRHFSRCRAPTVTGAGLASVLWSWLIEGILP